jgi:phosphate transport system protein
MSNVWEDTMDDSSARPRSHDFEAEMHAVRERFAGMAARCRGQMHLALEAFWTGSREKIGQVEAADDAIDDEEKAIDALVLRILALRQPVASDLRMLTALFKLITDLERIGDEAVDIARAAGPLPPDIGNARERLQQMADATDKMLGGAVRSFLEGDAQLAEEVLRTDDVVDGMHREILRACVALLSRHPVETAPAMGALSVAKCLERIADHATNIAEGTLFMVQADETFR